MAKKRKFTFLKSNYTLRTKHKTLNKKDTSIYVRDYMVTTNNGGWDSGSMPYGEGNFKMVHRFDEKEARKHSYGKWLNNSQGDVWTLKEIEAGLSKYDNVKEINKSMVMNTNYKSLLDFAYFGNCSELIKASVTDIIQKFPGELYVTNKEFSYYDEKLDDIVTVIADASNGHSEEGKLYYIDNPFGIDIFTPSISPSTENKFKYFCVSRNSYKVLNKYETPCGIDMQRWIVEFQPNVNLKCLSDGQFVAKVLLLGYYNGENIVYRIDTDCNEKEIYTTSTFIVYVYFNNGEFVYLTDSLWEGFHIRLSDEKIEDFYQNNLDDFERFLLNRETKPRYLIEIETLKESDTGFKIGSMKLNWPTLSGGWNLDIEGPKYSSYIEKLLGQSQLYDEYYSNNLWRMMTHDSIKNMDLTFQNEKLNEDNSDYNIGISKLEGLFWVYGREFDDLKRYIENLKAVNNVSYDDRSQIAENILYEKASLNGWELYNPTQYLKNDTEVKQLYNNQFKIYTLSEVKNRFFTELLLNSKHIFARKGTKYGIEMLLTLFGFCSYDYGKHSYPNLSPNEQISGKTKWEDLNGREKELYYDYKIDEFVGVATNTSSDVLNENEDFPCAKYNALKTGSFGPSEFDMDVDPLEGLPVREVNFITSDGLVKKYIIPWYDKIQYNSNRMYFQMYGGWGKISLKDIDETINITQSEKQHFKELRSEDDFRIYSETLKYIKVKENIPDLLKTEYSSLNNGDIYYVNSVVGSEYHYYVLEDKEKSGSLEGWAPVTEEDFSTKTKNALNVIYLETIIDDYRANNPHVGYGKYDDGNEYLEYFRHLFKYEIDNSTADKPLFDESAYDCHTGGVLEEIGNCGFTIGDIVRDNVKTWYFTPSNFSYMELLEKDSEKEIYQISSESSNQIVNVGRLASDDGTTHYESDLLPFNLETQEVYSNDEAAANSIINVKNLKITFANKYTNFEGFRQYLYGVVLPYMTQLIPSTTILSVDFDGVESSDTVLYDIVQGVGII